MARFAIRPALTNRREYVFGDALGRRTDVVRLGRLAEAGSTVEVGFDASGEFVVAIFGKRGSGKSYCLGSILESLASTAAESTIGTSSRSRAVLLFDTLNIFWTLAEPLREEDRSRFAREWKALDTWRIQPPDIDANIYYPKGYGGPAAPKSYRPFALPPSALTADDWADLLEVDLFSDRVGQLLFDVYMKVSTDGWASEVESHQPNSSFDVPLLLRCLREDLEIAAYYSPETVRALGQRLRIVGSLPFLTGQSLDLSDVLRSGSLSILLMNRLPDTLRSVLVSVLMRRILMERSEASDLQKHLALARNLSSADGKIMRARLEHLIPSTIVALDEAQNVLPSERSTKATQAIVKFVREGRNHGLSMIFTTQQPSAIDGRILAQVDTIIGHRLTISADIRRFEDNQKARNPDSIQLQGRALTFGDWLRSLAPGQAIISNTEEVRNFVLDVRPRVCPHGGSGSV